MSRGGDAERAEFETSVRPHVGGVARLARLLFAGRPADAQDLVQEALLRAWSAFPRFEPGTNLRAWLFRIVRNTYVDVLRRRGREAELMDPGGIDTESVYSVEEFRSVAARTERRVDVERALARLPGELRLVLLLVDGEGLRYDEVAEIAECPIGTVRSRLHRARRLLRQELLAMWRGSA